MLSLSCLAGPSTLVSNLPLRGLHGSPHGRVRRSCVCSCVWSCAGVCLPYTTLFIVFSTRKTGSTAVHNGMPLSIEVDIYLLTLAGHTALPGARCNVHTVDRIDVSGNVIPAAMPPPSLWMMLSLEPSAKVNCFLLKWLLLLVL